jgi:hypothetical protein
VTVHGRARRVAVRPRRLTARPETWFLAGVAATALLLVGYSFVRPGKPRATVPAGGLDRSAAWNAWRALARERLSDAEPTEGVLREVLELRPTAPEGSPAAVLRHDQAVADVLLASRGVRSVLGRLVGIGEHFLGTGLSRPDGAAGYHEAAVHEYLIPNLRDDEASVWMTNLNPHSLDLDETIKQLVAEGGRSDDEAAQRLKKKITSLCEAKKRGAVLVRFALLDKKYYKNTLGHPDRVRVFASDLTEVWDLPVKDAADLSGYTFKSGDTFFVWIFIPSSKEEAIPATWEEVLKNLSGWMKEARERSASGAAAPGSRREPAARPGPAGARTGAAGRG